MTQRITYMSTAIMILAALFWLFWIYWVTGWMLKLTFNDTFWNGLRLVESHAERSITGRLGYACLSVATLITGCAAFAAGLNLLNHIRRGHYFTVGSCRAIRWFGIALLAAMAMDTVFDTLDHVFLSWDNTNTAVTLENGSLSLARPFIPPRFEFDSGDISLALCGLGFALLGYVLEIARGLEDETRAYV